MYRQTCVNTGVFLQTSLTSEGLVTEQTVELFNSVMKTSVHLQAVFMSKGLPTDPAGVGPYPCGNDH